MLHPHATRDQAKDLGVRLGLTEWLDRRLIQRRVQMAVRSSEGPSARSCVVAGSTMSAKSAVSVWKCSRTTVKRSSRMSPRTTAFLIGRDCRRIAVVHDERAHRRSAHAGIGIPERVTQSDHVDGPSRRREIETLERGVVVLEGAARRELHAAAGPAASVP